MSKLQEEKLHGSKKEGLAKIGRAQVRASREQECEECHAPGEKGYLKSGRGGKGGTVKSRKQAIAIGLSEARKKGAKVPKKKKAA